LLQAAVATRAEHPRNWSDPPGQIGARARPLIGKSRFQKAAADGRPLGVTFSHYNRPFSGLDFLSVRRTADVA